MSVRSRDLAIVGLVALAAVQSEAAELAKPKSVCRIMHARTKHVGETLTFAGRYTTDHIERSLVLPNGCDRGIGLGKLSPAAIKALSSLDKPLKRNHQIEATFTGTLVQESPNGFTFANDDGVRLNVASIANLKIVGPQTD